ncbi:hypothetical protein ACUBYH_003865 [Enterobacter hormaechei]|uniref:hypothetical protein n=1 Tax=Enterobacter cloacae complex TaxID=354276 RepID=UPI0012AB56EB|nr:hypothetical protein [Enterobacter hormaechei]MBE3443581.1 hypothetical protein [Enterobacter cloacae complex sp. P25RS]HED1501352.1 hypothetical protein [Enterobacter hormaechei subsp. hoffmannii]MDS1985735.1 hypothetical protein [Enterobacter hormaechei]MEA3822278.1 hypothetical protein [Enterobacter hormaechei]HCL8933133.1 hypothetical protein [Enterobacter hormaechei]
MKERGMIFNGEMVRAILDGRKTQTRRIVKVQPDTPEFGLRRIIESSIANEIGMYFWSQEDARGIKARSKQFYCPYGDVGDRIWVRETFSPVPDHEEPAGCSAILYAADGNGPYGKWVPSIHMPRWASRITLEITGVRVERLNSISDSDASKEGCCIADMESGDCLSDVFARLWTSIYGDESWKVNPWVWVIEFKVVPNVQDNPT